MNSVVPKLDFTVLSSIEVADRSVSAKWSEYPLSPFNTLTEGMLAINSAMTVNTFDRLGNGVTNAQAVYYPCCRIRSLSKTSPLTIQQDFKNSVEPSPATP